MNRKVEKKIRRKKVFFSLSFFIIFLGVLCLFLFKSNYFNIAAVSVENNNIVSADEINAPKIEKPKPDKKAYKTHESFVTSSPSY